MKVPTIKSKQFILRPFRKSDAQDLVDSIRGDKRIYNNTSQIPWPYTLKVARDWLEEIFKEKRKKKPSKINFAIEVEGKVKGSISLENIEFHKAEIGYWLGEEACGKGIATRAVKLVTRFGFEELKLKRIYALVFSFNEASKQVLEKAGYKKEGFLRKEIKKDSKYMDTYLYAKVK